VALFINGVKNSCGGGNFSANQTSVGSVNGIDATGVLRYGNTCDSITVTSPTVGIQETRECPKVTLTIPPVVFNATTNRCVFTNGRAIAEGLPGDGSVPLMVNGFNCGNIGNTDEDGIALNCSAPPASNLPIDVKLGGVSILVGGPKTVVCPVPATQVTPPAASIQTLTTSAGTGGAGTCLVSGTVTVGANPSGQAVGLFINGGLNSCGSASFSANPTQVNSVTGPDARAVLKYGDECTIASLTRTFINPPVAEVTRECP
jgi:hypothetical protein